MNNIQIKLIASCITLLSSSAQAALPDEIARISAGYTALDWGTASNEGGRTLSGRVNISQRFYLTGNHTTTEATSQGSSLDITEWSLGMGYILKDTDSWRFEAELLALRQKAATTIDKIENNGATFGFRATYKISKAVHLAAQTRVSDIDLAYQDTREAHLYFGLGAKWQPSEQVAIGTEFESGKERQLVNTYVQWRF